MACGFGPRKKFCKQRNLAYTNNIKKQIFLNWLSSYQISKHPKAFLEKN